MPSTVLIADDSLRIQKELTQLLKESGVEAVTVSNGEHAVRKLATVQPDLVLADIFMPVRSGYEVCEYIKTNEQFAHVGVLLLASKMEPYDEKEAQRVRADGKLEKPFADPGAVLVTIQEHLEKVTAQKPPAPPPPAEEPAAPPAAEPEPEPEPFSTRPAPVTFDTQAAPVGFTEVEEEAPPPVDLDQPTVLSTAEELERRLEPAEAPPGEETAEIAQAEEPSPPPMADVEAPPPPAGGEERVVEKPELAEAWEMTGPEPGAPEIPATGGWESQWKGGEEATAPPAEETPPPVEEAPPAAVEAPAEPSPARDEFAAAFRRTTPEPTPAPAEEAPALDPALIDQVVNQVVERLSPQVMETIAREIVRPLAETLLKEKLKG